MHHDHIKKKCFDLLTNPGVEGVCKSRIVACMMVYASSRAVTHVNMLILMKCIGYPLPLVQIICTKNASNLTNRY